MSSTARRVSIVLALVGVVLWFGFGRSQTVLESPAARILVTAENGLPLAGATITHRWRSYPYGGVQRVTRVVADRGGAGSLLRRSSSERIYPFCMHGVREHFHEICVTRAGYRTVVVRLAAAAEPLTLAIILRSGESVQCAADGHEDARPDVRSDLTGLAIESAVELSADAKTP